MTERTRVSALAYVTNVVNNMSLTSAVRVEIAVRQLYARNKPLWLICDSVSWHLQVCVSVLMYFLFVHTLRFLGAFFAALFMKNVNILFAYWLSWSVTYQ